MDKKHVLLLIIILLLVGVIVMPDAPDGYKFMLSSKRGILADMAELAARLGSFNVYSRTGSVFWMTDMTTGMSCWSGSGSGNDNSVTPAVVRSMYGGVSLVLQPGSTADYLSQITRKITPHLVNKWGLEMSVAFAGAFDEYRFGIIRFDGDNAHSARIVLSDTDQKIYLRTGNNVDEEVADLPELTDAYGFFHVMKVVGDFETNKYVGLWLDNIYHDLRGYDLAIYTAGDYPMSYIVVQQYGKSGAYDECIIDYVIMTTGEP